MIKTVPEQPVIRFGIEDDEKSQIISFLNNECNALNQFGCFVYNRFSVWDICPF